MKIRVDCESSLWSSFRKEPGKNRFEADVADGATIESVLRQIGIDPGFVGVVAVNAKLVRFDTALEEGDHLQLYPPAAGG